MPEGHFAPVGFSQRDLPNSKFRVGKSRGIVKYCYFFFKDQSIVPSKYGL